MELLSTIHLCKYIYNVFFVIMALLPKLFLCCELCMSFRVDGLQEATDKTMSVVDGETILFLTRGRYVI